MIEPCPGQIFGLQPGSNLAFRLLMRVIAAVPLFVCACVGSASDPPAGGDAGGDGGVAADSDANTAEADAGPAPAYPDETVTGWTPEGVVTSLDGNQSVTIDNMVLEDVDIDGCLSIQADNVIVRRVRVRCTGARGITVLGTALIEDVTVDGLDEGDVGVFVQGAAEMRRLDVHGFQSGVKFDSAEDSSIEDSYIHAPVPCATPADDDALIYGIAVITSDRITVKHNHIDRGGDDTCTGATPIQGAHTLYLQAADDSVIEDNLINGGSGWCVKIELACTDLVVVDNHFGATAHATCATKGAADSVFALDDDPDNANVGCSWTGNVWDTSGETIAPPE